MACLTQPAWQGAPLRVVVADSWVRYAIVPWVAELNSSDEKSGARPPTARQRVR